jgi:hypothetical protein
MIELTYTHKFYHRQSEMIQWASAHFGRGAWKQSRQTKIDTAAVWTVWSMFGRTHFEFDNESDAVLFALRWPGCL